MGFGEQLRRRRKELGYSREELAQKLGITGSAVGNYETGVSAPRESVLLRLFDVLQVEPNYLVPGLFTPPDAGERASAARRRPSSGNTGSWASPPGRPCVPCWTPWGLQAEAEQDRARLGAADHPPVPFPAAAGYAAPVFGEDYQLLTVDGEVPVGAELAVRIQGDSMEPYIRDESVVYVNHDPLRPGDVGIFCVDGDMLCKQYYRDSLGTVYLFSLNRSRSDADQVFTAGSGRSLTCFGRVMLHNLPLPI